MMRVHTCLCFLILVAIVLPLQMQAQVIFGTNNYIEYQVGQLPIVISVPHGGALTPAGIPDRTCNNPTTVTDANTEQLGRQIDSAFVARTGCHAHMIYCHLQRAKLDCNRNLADGACGNATAGVAWQEFYDFVDSAQALALAQFGGNAFYIDLHGHGHTQQRLELGYLLSGNELAFADSVLNSPTYVDYSSIRALVASNVHALPHVELLRGAYALGTLLGDAGYPSVPSQQIPNPGSDPYFSGGYNVANHTSYVPSIATNGVQIECNFAGVRDSYLSRRSFADSLVASLLQYLDYHLAVTVGGCGATAQEPVAAMHAPRVSPTLISSVGQTVQVSGTDLAGHAWQLLSLTGSSLDAGVIDAANQIHFTKALPTALMVLVLQGPSQPYAFRLMVVNQD
jgi:hypothetical protein